MDCAAFANSISTASVDGSGRTVDGPSSRSVRAHIALWGALVTWAAALLLAIVRPLPALAQSGGPYVVTSSVIAGGGSTTPAGAGTTVSGTIGQPLANPSGPATGGEFAVSAGFWPAQEAAAAPTPSVTMTMLATASVTPTLTNTPVSSATATTAMPTLSPTIPSGTTTTPTRTGTAAPTTTTTQPPTATTSATATPSATPTPPACAGDCSGDGTVSVEDLVELANIVLDQNGQLTNCPVGDANLDGTIAINDILVGVNNALHGCP